LSALDSHWKSTLLEEEDGSITRSLAHHVRIGYSEGCRVQFACE
jgi:hypothetical protein